MSRAFSAGLIRYEIISSAAGHTHTVSITLPDASVHTIDTTVGTSGVLGTVAAGNITVTFNDTDVDFPGSWDDSNATHCRVSAIPGGYRYQWDDSGPQGVPDGTYTDLVMQVRVPQAIVGGSPETYVRVAVYQSDATTLIANVPRRRNVKWQDEVNSPGSAQFDIRLDDDLLIAHPELVNKYNVVKYFVNGVAVKAWILEDVVPVRVTSGGDADRWVTISGRGAESALDAAVVYPEYGMRDYVSEDRAFNFASIDGVWRIASEWVTPVGYAWSADTTTRKTYPRDWPDPNAQWLWSSSPATSAPVGPNWFRSTFTVTDSVAVVVYATGDNMITLYLDGQLIADSGTTQIAWRTSYQYRTMLAAGTHTLAAVVTNTTLVGGGNNPGAYIATIFRTDSSGARTTTNVFRTSTTNTIVKPYGAAPGWNGANILQQLIIEAQDRNVDAVLPITFSFDTTNDSYGVPWDDRQDRVAKVGTTDLTDLATQVIELSLDMAIDPDFVMHAWKHRGVDMSDTIILRENRDVTAGTGSSRGARVRNQALLKYDGGWMELYSAVSKTTYGRREVGLSLGTSTSTDQTKLAGQAALREVVAPEETIPVTITSVSGPQPYLDYNLGDTILVPAVMTGMTKGRLMSITASESGEGGVIQWDLDFYPEVDDSAITTIVTATGSSYNDTSALYAHEIMSDSPWGYWRLTETAGTTWHDLSGFAHHVYSVGSPTLDQAGPVDRAVSFSTATQYARTDGNNEYQYKYATVEAWVFVSARPTANFSSIIAMSDVYAGATHDKEMYLDTSGFLSFRVFTTTSHTVTSTTALTLNKWYHVAASVGPSGLRLYLNGALNASNTTAVTSQTTPTKRVYIRGGGSGYNTTDSIVIAEPAVFSQQLLDSRIQAHFSAAEFTP